MRRRVLGSTVVALVSLGAAASTVGAAAAPDANLVAARAAAQRIVSVTPLPSGAVAQSTDPSADGSLSRVFHARGVQQVILTQYWTVSGTPGSVSDFIYSNPPAGSRLFAEEGVGEPSPSVTGWQEQRSFPGQTGRVTSELLQITTTAARGGGTAIRADAIVLWRPTWEQIPASTRAARVRLDGFPQRAITGAALTGLRSLIDTEPVVAPGVYSCPAGLPGQAIGITFVDARGRTLAHVAYDSADGCGWLQVKVAGRRAPALLGGWELVPRVWSAGGLIRCTAPQLRVAIGAPALDGSQGAAQLTVHNVARTPCSLRGDPTISLRAASGRRLPVGLARPRETVNVASAPGHGMMAATFSWSPPRRRCGLPAPASAIVGLPGIAARLAVALTPSRHRLGPCTGRIQTSPLLGVWQPPRHDAHGRS